MRPAKIWENLLYTFICVYMKDSVAIVDIKVNQIQFLILREIQPIVEKTS